MSMSPRSLLFAARSTAGVVADFPPFTRRADRRLAYVGWSGNGNLGDDAMIAAHRKLLPEWDVVQVPNHRGFDRLTGQMLSRVAGICLGGGTLILNGHFRTTLERLMRAAPNAPRVMLGVGVEDLEYQKGRRAGVAAEVDRWRPLLAEFDVVRVRGPLSQGTLQTVGVDSVVVGDPALAVPGAAAVADRGRPTRVGINFGVTDDLWGGDPETFRAVMVAGVERLVAQGADVILLATTVEDRAHLQGVRRELAQAGVQLPTPNAITLSALDAAIRGCDLVVGEKLHALVLAARLGVPTLGLEYRPKCRDFQLSIGRGDHVVRTSDLAVDALVESVAHALSTNAVDRATMYGHVVARQACLTSAATSIRTVLGPRP